MIREVGQIYRDTYDTNYKTTINMSSIYSFLIKEVGTKVSHYQSDVYYNINMIEKAINNLTSEVFIVALMKSGVDSKLFVENSIGRNYINIYQISINVDFNKMEITAELVEVDYKGYGLYVAREELLTRGKLANCNALVDKWLKEFDKFVIKSRKRRK